MSLNLLKLCVGCDSIADLEGWICETLALCRRLGRTPEQVHTTRLVPKRHGEIVEGGSLYWVMKGQITCRQPVLAIRPFTDPQGIARCHLVLEPAIHAVEPRPCRPFQGWRYLEGPSAPRDLAAGEGEGAGLPEAMRQELRALGLL